MTLQRLELLFIGTRRYFSFKSSLKWHFFVPIWRLGLKDGRKLIVQTISRDIVSSLDIIWQVICKIMVEFSVCF